MPLPEGGHPLPDPPPEERNFGGACSDKGVQNIHRSFWDEFIDKNLHDARGATDIPDENIGESFSYEKSR
jgi:hypothetical protein